MFSGGGSKVVGNFSDWNSGVFQKGAPEISANLLDFSTRVGFVCPFLSLRGVSDIVLWLFLWALLPLFSSHSWGFSEVIVRTNLRLRATPQEVFNFPSFSLVLLWRRCLWKFSLISEWSFCFSRISPCSLRRIGLK